MVKKLPETITASRFKAQCLELMDLVAASGSTLTITKRGVPVARLTPMVERPKTLRGIMKGEVAIIGDIVSPVDVAWEVNDA